MPPQEQEDPAIPNVPQESSQLTLNGVSDSVAAVKSLEKEEAVECPVLRAGVVTGVEGAGITSTGAVSCTESAGDSETPKIAGPESSVDSITVHQAPCHTSSSSSEEV